MQSPNGQLEVPKTKEDFPDEEAHESPQPQASFDKDFVVISEFSELVGPVCLFVLPPGGAGQFDLNKFVLKIMSVDHQAKSTESGVYGEDTQVVMRDDVENAYCYVHHFTLLDIFARGYVRPMCMSFITRDNRKIMNHFEDFHREFSCLSNMFKAGNYTVFKDDLSHRLADLAFTKEVAQRRGTSGAAAATTSAEGECEGQQDIPRGAESMDDLGYSLSLSTTPGALSKQFHDFANMRSRLDAQQPPWMRAAAEAAAVRAAPADASVAAPARAHSDSFSSSEHGSRDVVTASYSSSTRSPPSVLRKGERSPQQDSEPHGTGPHHHHSDAHHMVGQLELGDDDLGSSSPPRLHVVPHADTPSDDDDGQLVTTAPSTPLAVSSAGHGSSNVDEDTATHTPGQEGEASPGVHRGAEGGAPEDGEASGESDAEEYSSVEEGDDMLSEVVEGIVQQMGLSCTYKPKLIKSLHRTRTFNKQLRELPALGGALFQATMQRLDHVRCHFSRPTIVLTLEAQDVSLMHPASSLMVVGGVPLMNFNWRADQLLKHWNDHRRAQGTTEDEADEVGSDASSSASDSSVVYGSPYASLTEFGAQLDDISATATYAWNVVSQNMRKHASLMKPAPTYSATPSLEDMLSEGLDVEMSAIDRTLLQRMLPESVYEKSLPLDTFASMLWGDSENVQRTGILRLMSFAFAPHLLFALLTGTTVIVHGTDEALVREVVRACASFVPGFWGCPVVHEWWEERTVRVVDLAAYKVIGLPKQVHVSPSLERYVALLDVDRETLWAQPYKDGVFVNDLVGSNKQWPNEESMMAYVHYTLFNLAMTACLYYYMCCVGVPADPGEQLDPQRPSSPSRPSPTSLPELPKSASSRFAHRRSTTEDMRRSLSMADGFGASVTAPGSSVLEQSPGNFFTSRRIGAHDAAIIMHMAEVVKEQQTMEMYGAGNATPPIRLSFGQRVSFRNEWSKNRSRSRSSALSRNFMKRGSTSISKGPIRSFSRRMSMPE